MKLAIQQLLKLGNGKLITGDVLEAVTLLKQYTVNVVDEPLAQTLRTLFVEDKIQQVFTCSTSVANEYQYYLLVSAQTALELRSLGDAGALYKGHHLEFHFVRSLRTFAVGSTVCITKWVNL